MVWRLKGGIEYFNVFHLGVSLPCRRDNAGLRTRVPSPGRDLSLAS